MKEETKTAQIGATDLLGDGACYVSNLARLLATLKLTLPVQPDGKIKLDLKTAVALIQALWDAFKTSAKECEGKEIVLPSTGLIWSTVRFLLATLGLRL